MAKAVPIVQQIVGVRKEICNIANVTITKCSSRQYNFVQLCTIVKQKAVC